MDSKSTKEDTGPRTCNQERREDCGFEGMTHYQSTTLAVSVLTLIVAGIVAAIYGLQLNTMWKVFTATQRPWVIIDKVDFDDAIAHSIRASLKNVGGGPAFDIELTLGCEMLPTLAGKGDADLATSAAGIIDRARKQRQLWWPSIGQSDSRAGNVIDSNLDSTIDRSPFGIYCCGAVTYRATDRSLHETRFATEYNTLAPKLRAQATVGMGPNAFWLSNSFDAGDFKAIGGSRLNYAN